ncbi:MAG: hypothetical protein HOP15_15695 [Planctomycetes bacterium]|nr:hypothetical protein [Planctomycetota bacterium]
MKLLSTALVVLVLSGLALARQEKGAVPAPVADAAAEAKLIAQQLPTYPLTTCPVSNEPLEGKEKPFDLVHEGRLVRLCCKACVKEFKNDPAVAASIFKSIDEGVIRAQKDTYPLATCAVSGEQLGSMGDPVELVVGTRLVRLCCKGCVKGVKKDPTKTLATIDAALISEQKKTYPLSTCLVSGEELGSEGFDYLHGVRLTRFCCEKCVSAFSKEPAKFLAALDKATPKKN